MNKNEPLNSNKYQNKINKNKNFDFFEQDPNNNVKSKRKLFDFGNILVRGGSLKRTKLWIYTYRKFIFVLFLLFLICLSISLWLALDFFKFRSGPLGVDNTTIANEYQDYLKNGNPESAGTRLINDWFFQNYLNDNPNNVPIPSNPTHNGQFVFFGSTACSACRRELDVNYKRWNSVQKNPILYKYTKNLGPLNIYGNQVSNDNIKDYWKKYEYNPNIDTKADRLPEPMNVFLKDNKHHPNKKPLVYDYSKYSLGNKKGLPGANNPVSQMIYGLLNSSASASLPSQASQYNPHVTLLQYNSSYKSNFKSSVKSNQDYFNDHLKNSFTVQDLPQYKDPTSITTYPLIGVIDDYAWYYKKNDESNRIYQPKLFLIKATMDPQEITDFIYYVFSGNYNTDSNTWTPYWKLDSDNKPYPNE